MFLTNYKILIISGQAWGGAFLSKHHYAVELSRCGNSVYFLNPPTISFSSQLGVEATQYDNLYEIRWHLPVRFWKRLGLFKCVDKLFTKVTKNFVEKYSIDIIWDFDQSIKDLSLLPVQYRIYHLVDNFEWKSKRNISKNADFIFSVSQVILNKFKGCGVNCHLINHGLSGEFQLLGETLLSSSNMVVSGTPEAVMNVKVGYVGNLLMDLLDRQTFKEIINQNHNVEFQFFGFFTLKDSNLGGANDVTTKSWIDFLKSKTNVKLFGNFSKSELVQAIKQVDCFIICYDDKKLHQRGANSHKILEYLSTGKVIVSNYIDTYNSTNLLVMPNGMGKNHELNFLLQSVINRIQEYNGSEECQMRIKYALKNTYLEHIKTIETIINNQLP